MKEEDWAAKRDFIPAYFDDFAGKIARVKRIQELDMPEEAITLACCYIAALANLRYEDAHEWRRFVRLVNDYSCYRNILSRISIPDILQNGKDNNEKNKRGKPLARYHEIVEVLKAQFGSSADHCREVPKARLIKILKEELNGLDEMNLDRNLDRFSYAALLYDQYRNPGVHHGGMAHVYNVDGPVFRRSPSGEPIYYLWTWLQFSIDFIISLLEEVHTNLASECIKQIKWPHELSRR